MKSRQRPTNPTMVHSRIINSYSGYDEKIIAREIGREYSSQYDGYRFDLQHADFQQGGYKIPTMQQRMRQLAERAMLAYGVNQCFEMRRRIFKLNAALKIAVRQLNTSLRQIKIQLTQSYVTFEKGSVGQVIAYYKIRENYIQQKSKLKALEAIRREYKYILKTPKMWDDAARLKTEEKVNFPIY